MHTRAYLGLDVHKKHTTAHLVCKEADGELRHFRLGQVDTDRDALSQALARWQLDHPAIWPPTAVLEACGGYSMLVHDVVVEGVDQVWVVDPSEVARFRGRRAKADRQDARLMAELAAKQLLRPLWVPPASVYGIRALMRTRRCTVNRRTASSNRLRSIAAAACDLTIAGHVWSRQNARKLTEARWIDANAQAAGMILLEQVLFDTQQIIQLDRRVAQLFEACEDAQIVASLPRCSRVLGLMVATEIGHIGRFASAARLRSYAGLAPKVSESAGQRHDAGVVKHGNRYLKFALVQIANQLCFLGSDQHPLAAEYWRTRRRLGQIKHLDLKTRVVMASKLCPIVFALLRDRRPYEPIWPKQQGCAAAEVAGTSQAAR